MSKVPVCGTTTAHARGCRCQLCCAARSAYDRQRTESGGEQLRERKRQQYAARKEAQNARRRLARSENPEAFRAAEKAAYEANRAARAEQKRAARAADPNHARQVNRDWRSRTGRGRVHTANRRARVRQAFVEEVDPLVVFDRDGYVCQGCGRDCPKEAKWPQREAATVDHIIPLARGGEHSYANTQTLCFRCNTSKGARTAPKTPPVRDVGEVDAHRVTAAVPTS